MASTWHTQEVIRHLEEADPDAIAEIIREAEASEEDPEEALRDWLRSGEAPKSLFDAIYRFSNEPAKVFDQVEWNEVIEHFSR